MSADELLDHVTVFDTVVVNYFLAIGEVDVLTRSAEQYLCRAPCSTPTSRTTHAKRA